MDLRTNKLYKNQQKLEYTQYSLQKNQREYSNVQTEVASLEKKLDVLLKENKSCYIGLSSRAQRMVAAKRLITEASEALVHAQQDPNTPVTAFRVNTEKYMKLISQ